MMGVCLIVEEWQVGEDSEAESGWGPLSGNRQNYCIFRPFGFIINLSILCRMGLPVLITVELNQTPVELFYQVR